MPWLLSLLLAASLAEDPRFADAAERMRKLDYEGAVTAFDALLEEARPDGERVTLLLYSGAARALLGDDGAARLAFESALRIDPDTSFDLNTSPKVVALFDDVKHTVSARAGPPPPADGRAGPALVPSSAAAPPSPRSSTAAAPRAHAPAAEEQASPDLAAVAGIGAAVVGAAAGMASVAFGLDVAGKMQTASDKGTSQQDAQALVDDANASLLWASVLGGACVAGAGTAVAMFVFGDAPEPAAAAAAKPTGE